MQFHFDGFTPGDPHIKSKKDADFSNHQGVDVLIVGCGPAGLTLASQLCQYPNLKIRIVDQKSGPLKIGQADGIACRSMEMFEAFDFAEKVAKESYWVNETNFWRPTDDDSKIVRADRIKDVEDDLSEMPHTILSQARIHDFYLEVMKNSSHGLEPDYNHKLISLSRTDGTIYPIKAVCETGGEGETVTINSKYVVGCDGARSTVRKSLGYKLKGESSRQLWGVMDTLAVTNFPDIRLKCAVQSAEAGSLLIIPREGGAMVRTYIELGALTAEERAADRNVTAESLISQTQAILAPYSFDVKEVAWFSAYEIGQRVCDRFDDVGTQACTNNIPRVFIAGDACHTHSPKAGQGMNISMADAFNLGWKLGSVLAGYSSEKLLLTYSLERQVKAQELIDFDKEMASLFATRAKDKASSAKFQKYFQKYGRYTAGVETRYDPSIIVSKDSKHELATGLRTGMRFHSALVIRVADAKPMHLGHALKADGRWRIIAFAPEGDFAVVNDQMNKLADYLANDPTSPVVRTTPTGEDLDSVIDFRAVYQTPHRDISLDMLPSLLMPPKGKFGLTDYEKVFSSVIDEGRDIFNLRGIDRNKGALIIVRPDQFISNVLELQDHGAIGNTFSAFMVDNDLKINS